MHLIAIYSFVSIFIVNFIFICLLNILNDRDDMHIILFFLEKGNLTQLNLHVHVRDEYMYINTYLF